MVYSANLFLMNIAAQIIGFLALGSILAGYSLKDDYKVRLLNLIGCSLWLIHFMILEKWSSFGALTISVLMLSASVVGLRFLEKPLTAVNALMVLAMVWAAQFGASQWANVIPAFGSLLMNVGVVLYAGAAMTRLISLGAATWLLFGILIANPFVITANALTLCSLALRAYKSRGSNGPRPQQNPVQLPT